MNAIRLHSEDKTIAEHVILKAIIFSCRNCLVCLGMPMVWLLVMTMPFLDEYTISVRVKYFCWFTIFGNLPQSCPIPEPLTTAIPQVYFAMIQQNNFQAPYDSE